MCVWCILFVGIVRSFSWIRMTENERCMQHYSRYTSSYSICYPFFPRSTFGSIFSCYAFLIAVFPLSQRGKGSFAVTAMFVYFKGIKNELYIDLARFGFRLICSFYLLSG